MFIDIQIVFVSYLIYSVGIDGFKGITESDWDNRFY